MPKYERVDSMSSSVGSNALTSGCQPKSPRSGRPWMPLSSIPLLISPPTKKTEVDARHRTITSPLDTGQIVTCYDWPASGDDDDGGDGMPQTAAERMAMLRGRQKRAGLVTLTLVVPASDTARLREWA